MMKLSSILLSAVALLPAALAAPGPASDPDQPAELMERQWGGGGYFWSYWSEGGGNFNCQNGAGGSYTTQWSGNGGFVCGKGWSPGGARYVFE